MVKGLSASICPKFVGKVNLAEGILSELGMTPIGAGSQEPDGICFPSVRGTLTVAQKWALDAHQGCHVLQVGMVGRTRSLHL